jgi:hypothetical protein
METTFHADLKKESSLSGLFFVPSKYAKYYACLHVIYNKTSSNRLIQETLTTNRTAETGNAIVAAIFAFEFVVIREFVVCVNVSNLFRSTVFLGLTLGNVLERIDDNSPGAVDFDNLCRAVGRTAMVDEASNATLLRCVDNLVISHTEEVTASDTLFVVFDLAKIGHFLTYFFADIFDDEVVGGNILHGVQSPTVDGRPVELDMLLSLLKGVELDSIGLTTSSSEILLLQVDVVDQTSVVSAIAARCGD